MNNVKFDAYIYHNIKNPIEINNISIKNIVRKHHEKNILSEINIDYNADYIFKNDLDYFLSDDKIDKKLSTDLLTVYKNVEITEKDFNNIFADAEIAEYKFDRGVKIIILLNSDVTAFTFCEEPEDEESQLMSDFFNDFPVDKEYISIDGMIKLLDMFYQKVELKLSIEHQAEELSLFERDPNFNGKHYYEAMKETYLLDQQEYLQKVEKAKLIEEDYLKLFNSVIVL